MLAVDYLSCTGLVHNQRFETKNDKISHFYFYLYTSVNRNYTRMSTVLFLG